MSDITPEIEGLLAAQEYVNRTYRPQIDQWIKAGAPAPPVAKVNVGFLAAQVVGLCGTAIKALEERDLAMNAIAEIEEARNPVPKLLLPDHELIVVGNAADG